MAIVTLEVTIYLSYGYFVGLSVLTSEIRKSFKFLEDNLLTIMKLFWDAWPFNEGKILTDP